MFQIAVAGSNIGMITCMQAQAQSVAVRHVAVVAGTDL